MEYNTDTLISELLDHVDWVEHEPVEIPFGDLLGSWLPFARKVLHEESALCHLLSATALRELEEQLLRRWSEIAAPAMTLEMHAHSLTGALEGETSAARYHYFVKKILGTKQGLQSLFEEYPVLKRQLGEVFFFWLESSTEFLERLDLLNLGPVQSLRAGLSDSHNRGRTVLRVTFETGVTLFYKPKQMKIAVLFNQLLEELNAKGLSAVLRPYRVIDCGAYGWVENIERSPCQTKEEVSLYYERAGALLCLMYLLQGTDFHCENVIASGAFPMLVDLETFFHPEMRNVELEEVPLSTRHSVLESGFLPFFQIGEPGKKCVNLGGLPTEENQEYGSPSLSWEALFTDEMRILYRSQKVQLSENRVELEGQLQWAQDHISEIIKGFTSLYRFVQSHRELVPSWIEPFAQAPVRFVCRDTQLYGRLLQRITDPQVVRGEENMLEELKVLRDFLLQKGNEHLLPIWEEEQQALLRHDIPYFESHPGSTALFIGERKVMDDCFSTPTIAKVRERVAQMSEEDLTLQTSFITGSLYPFKASMQKESQSRNFATAAERVSDKDLEERAVAIGKQLLSQATIAPSGCLSWLSLEVLPMQDQMLFQTLSPTLYSGVLGIALFFSALYAKTGDPLWKEAVQNALSAFRKTLHKDVGRRWPGALGIGAMAGAGGMIYAAAHIGSLLNDPSYLDDAGRIASFCRQDHIDADKAFDVIGGSAGCILALLALHEKRADPSLLTFAKACGQHLERNFVEEERGGWGRWKLLGFSHGIAGIAYSLLKLSRVINEPAFSQLADRAIAWERKFFSTERGNWPDFRRQPPDDTVSWCHGATGIGLGRVAMLRLKQDAQIEKEIAVAIEATKKSLFTLPQQLCCGVLGRLEFLFTAAEFLQDKPLQRETEKLLATFLQEVDLQGRFRCFPNLPEQLHSPGFMQGMAGVGYTFLRFADRGKTLPQVLLLD